MKKVIILNIIAIILCVIALALLAAEQIRERKLSEELYTVQKGDCLWTIKNSVCPEYEDTRDWVYKVTEMNNITEPIQPGQKIVVLVAADK